MNLYSVLAVATVALGPLCADAQEVAFLARPDAEAAVVGKVLVFHRASDGKEIRWEIRKGGDLFADNRGSNHHDAGTWQLKDDGALCTAFRTNSEDSCYYFYKDGAGLRRTNGKRPGDVAKSVAVVYE